MSRYEGLIKPEVIDYILKNSVREPEILARLRADTEALPRARMQIPPEQGQLFQLLIRMTGAKQTIEIGVFTGYSALAVALALPPEGRIIACDISDEYASMARRYWAEAGVAKKIDLRIAPALTTLDGLISSGAGGSFDFAFIDADKVNHSNYYDRCLKLIRPGGLIAIDNMIWDGKVIDASVNDEDTVAIRELSDLIYDDHRVDALLLPFADGITLAVKR